MKVGVLGAGGAMGRRAPHHLAELNGVAKLVLADLNVSAARQSAASLVAGQASITVTSCDGLDANAVRRLLEPAEPLVMGTW